MEILIPEPLFGTQREVKRAWKSITRKAIRLGGWDSALGNTEMIPLRDTHGKLILDGPESAPDWHVFLCLVIMHLGELCYLGDEQRNESNLLLKRLILDGLERPWFQLAMLGGSPLWLYGADNREVEAPPLAARALSKLLAMWPSLVSLDDRFGMCDGQANPWPGWASRPFVLCTDFGVPEHELRPVRIAAFERRLDAWEAAEKLSEFLVRWRRRNPGPSSEF